MSIEHLIDNDPVGWHEKVNDLLAYWEMGAGAAPTSFGFARSRLNAMAGALALPTIAEADAGSVRRSKINALIDGSGIPDGLDLYADFTTGRYWDNGGQSMAAKVVDTWSGGFLPNAAGVYSSVGANVLARNDAGLWTQPTRTNEIRNPIMSGATVGTPGGLPTFWANPSLATGLARQVVGMGVEDGINYIDVKCSGTATSASNLEISFEQAAQIVAASGDVWSFSAFLRIVAGSVANLTTITPIVRENTAAGGFVANRALGNQKDAVAATTDLKSGRVQGSVTFSGGATVARAFPYILFGIPNGATVDFTVRIGLPQIEKGAFATHPAVSNGASASTRTGNRQVAAVPNGGRAFILDFDLLEPVTATAVTRLLLNYRSAASGTYRHWVELNPNGTIYARSRSADPDTSSTSVTAPGTLVQGRNIIYGVLTQNWRRLGIVATGDSPIGADAVGSIAVDQLGILGNASSASQNTYGRARRLGELRNVADPAAAFATVKAIAQGLAT